MPDMPQTAAKGSILKRLDNALRDQAARAPILTKLQSGISLLEIMSQEGIAINEDDRRHLANDWFGANWWPGAQAGVGAIEQILRAGFIGAINRANELGVPIDTYWICHPGHGAAPHADVQLPVHEDVEVTVLWSAQQVTVIIHTPEPKQPSIPDAPRTIDEPISVWFWKDGGVKSEQPKHRP